MANENCLKDMGCPKCGSPGPLKIYQTLCVGVWSDDGLEETTEPEIDPDSDIECLSCGYRGPHDEFAVENQAKGQVVHVQFLLTGGDTGWLADALSDMRDDNCKQIDGSASMVEWRLRPPSTTEREDPSTEELTGSVDARIAARDWCLTERQTQMLGLESEIELISTPASGEEEGA